MPRLFLEYFSSVSVKDFENVLRLQRMINLRHFIGLIFRTLSIKNCMNPEFENCLMEDFKIADMGMNLLRVIHTVGTL